MKQFICKKANFTCKYIFEDEIKHSVDFFFRDFSKSNQQRDLSLRQR
uniref:Uncharacterized protein n=1 Tax=Meloidogyne enterolobii TaxID=390850 RepID=A0A6V7UTU0_MELEN|nr:unnamed protein product [Meloidogyne enterolobii]